MSIYFYFFCISVPDWSHAIDIASIAGYGVIAAVVVALHIQRNISEGTPVCF